MERGRSAGTTTGKPVGVPGRVGRVVAVAAPVPSGDGLARRVGAIEPAATIAYKSPQDIVDNAGPIGQA